jgi:hypothetical protein
MDEQKRPSVQLWMFANAPQECQTAFQLPDASEYWVALIPAEIRTDEVEDLFRCNGNRKGLEMRELPDGSVLYAGPMAAMPTGHLKTIGKPHLS